MRVVVILLLIPHQILHMGFDQQSQIYHRVQLCKEYLDWIKVSSEDIDNICRNTIDQNDDDSGEWIKQHQGHVTASSFGMITKRKS